MATRVQTSTDTDTAVIKHFELVLLYYKVTRLIKKYYKVVTKLNKLITFIKTHNEASRGAGSQSVTVKSTGCGFDPYSRR